MEPVKCLVCQEPINVFDDHLVSALFVAAKSGALLEHHFHGRCYVKWRAERAERSERGGRLPKAGAATKKDGPASTEAAPAVPSTPAEEVFHLTAEERAALERLRGRRD